MTPASPVMLKQTVAETVFAKNQPQYRPLPAVICLDGTVITRWTLTWRERLRVLFGGSIYLEQLTFGDPLQPQLPSVEEPTLNMEPT